MAVDVADAAADADADADANRAVGIDRERHSNGRRAMGDSSRVEVSIATAK